MRTNEIFAASLITLIGLGAPSLADEGAEQYVQDALPLMYHTCDSVVEEAAGDEDFIVDVVTKMAALSFVNRNIAFESYAESDAEKEKIREDFIEALRIGCDEDRNALLGGVVDNAVKSSLGL